MKPESIVLAVAGMCFGVIVGWLLANVDADRAAARAALSQPAVAQPTAAGNERQPPSLDTARVQALTTILEADPKNVGAAVDLGTTYFEAERFEEATRWYEEAIRNDPRNLEALAQLGMTYFVTRGPDPALEQFERALKIDATHPRTLLNKGIVLWRGKEDLKGAEQVWRTLVSSAPATPEAQMAQQGLEAMGVGHEAGAASPSSSGQ